MNDLVSNICRKLDNELKTIESEFSDVLKIAERSIVCISASLKLLKVHIGENKFPNQETEILFFKEIKPSIYSKLIYFIKIFNIESKRPNGSDKSQRRYFRLPIPTTANQLLKQHIS